LKQQAENLAGSATEAQPEIATELEAATPEGNRTLIRNEVRF